VKKSGSVKIISPNPKELCTETLYKEKIRILLPGPDDAEAYHRTVSYALSRVFRKSLRNMEIKQEIDDGIKIIDTLFTNCAQEGFFHNLKSQIESTYPIVEAKNIKGDPGNSEFDQLNGRMNKYRGKFGILVCRNIKDKARAVKICKTYLPDRYVIFLTDDEVFRLLELSREGNINDINDLMDNRLKEVIF
jgi:hypothetical protein